MPDGTPGRRNIALVQSTGWTWTPTTSHSLTPPEGWGKRFPFHASVTREPFWSVRLESCSGRLIPQSGPRVQLRRSHDGPITLLFTSTTLACRRRRAGGRLVPAGATAGAANNPAAAGRGAEGAAAGGSTAAVGRRNCAARSATNGARGRAAAGQVQGRSEDSAEGPAAACAKGWPAQTEFAGRRPHAGPRGQFARAAGRHGREGVPGNRRSDRQDQPHQQG